MVTWEEFALQCPELAEAGKRMIYQFGPGLGYLATVRKDGAPRLHPVCPLLADNHLYVFIHPQSPKNGDLLRDGRYALHTFPPEQGDDEFFCAGNAEHITDPQIRARAVAAVKHRKIPDHEVFFELKIERVLHTTWENWATPKSRPLYTRWRAP